MPTQVRESQARAAAIRFFENEAFLYNQKGYQICFERFMDAAADLRSGDTRKAMVELMDAAAHLKYTGRDQERLLEIQALIDGLNGGPTSIMFDS